MGIIETIKMLTLEEGVEKGEQKKTYDFVRNLLLNTDFDIPKIAALANAKQSFVKKVKADIGQES